MSRFRLPVISLLALLLTGGASVCADPPPAAAVEPTYAGTLLRPLPNDDDAVARLATRVGEGARILLTAHFALVHTASAETADAIAARLEAVYQANVRFVVALRLDVRNPSSKLPIVLYGSYEQFRAGQQAAGSADEDVLGYYAPADDCSFFFDLTTYPPIIRLHEELARVAATDGASYRRLRSRVQQRTEMLLGQVIQHEAAHHIHSRLGLFGPQDHAPTWLAEGLAQLFELPFVERRASLPLSTNRYRLFEFWTLHGDSPTLADDVRRIVADDGQWRGGRDYALSWALTDYLYKRQRQRLAHYLHITAVHVATSAAERREAFEQVFGPIDDAFVNGFREYLRRVRARYESGRRASPGPRR